MLLNVNISPLNSSKAKKPFSLGHTKSGIYFFPRAVVIVVTTVGSSPDFTASLTIFVAFLESRDVKKQLSS